MRRLDPDTPRERLERVYSEFLELVEQSVIDAAVEATYPLDQYQIASPFLEQSLPARAGTK